MGPPTVNFVLVIVLGLLSSLPAGPLMVHAEGGSVVPNAGPDEDTTTTPSIASVDNQCSPLQKRQDLLDNRMNERDTRLNRLDTRLSTQITGLDNRLSTQITGLDTRLSELQTQLNGLDTRLSTQLNTRQNEVNSRFNRMNSRLDGIETAIADMKGFLQERMEAMDKKVEWALTDIRPRPEVGTTQPDTNPQQDDNACTKPQGLIHFRGGPRNLYPPLHSRSVGIMHQCRAVYRGCEDALSLGQNTSGVYNITPDHDEAFSVYCDQRIDGGGWTVFQSRYDGSVDFYNDWITYKEGFGELTAEFWLGNDKIHNLTKHHNMQLRVELTSPAGEVQYADYSQFWIDDEAHQYTLTVTGYKGGSPPGDSLSYHNGKRFSTRDNDATRRCAAAYMGAWWYNGCHTSNLNGLSGGTSEKGLTWSSWKGPLSMRATRMMMRRKP